MTQRRILVTAALPYANGHIHLGHLVEYLQTDTRRTIMLPDRPVQFRLEIVDPGTSALTYEFEFI